MAGAILSAGRRHFPVLDGRRGARSGQTAVEYVLAAGVMLACVGVLAVFLYALRQHAGRVIRLIASDSP